ncbi:hypothetical protein [Vibrio sp. 10N.261.51.F12]|uniref:hypothetical protein n=1 Tax=Vibrio sp. 10N.261.51.F12 TaxID=3229679 RepID=UPI0035531462
MKLQVSTIGKTVLYFWLGMLAASCAFFIAVRFAAFIDYDAINGLTEEKYYPNGSLVSETVGLVEFVNHLMYVAFVRGNILNLLILSNLSFMWSSVKVIQLGLVIFYLLKRAMLSNFYYYSASAFLLLYVFVSVNLAGFGDWSNASTFSLFEMQTLYDYGYWGSVSLWLETQNWSLYAWFLISVMVSYTLVKAHVLATILTVVETKEEFKKLTIGCALAVFAPYRLSQFIGATRDQVSEGNMNMVRSLTLEKLRFKPEFIDLINYTLTHNRFGFVGLTDLSSSYIPLIFDDTTNAPKHKFYYLFAMPLIFFTLLYTGIIRRPFYLLPILFVNIALRLSVVSLILFIFILYLNLLPLPIEFFIERLEALFNHLPSMVSLRDQIIGAELQPLPDFSELKIMPVNMWFFEPIIPVPSWKYVYLFCLFIGACINSMVFDVWTKIKDN